MQYKFRGKTPEGKWVYGDLQHDCFDGGSKTFPVGIKKAGNYPIEVLPETVGMWTGLKDKNDTDVYIGDIVKCTRGCPHEVEWRMEYGGTYIGGMPCIYLAGLNDGYAWTGQEEITGNIFDNPIQGKQ